MELLLLHRGLATSILVIIQLPAVNTLTTSLIKGGLGL